MRATAIIGANFGDEGKGLMTDYFASQHERSVVVRFNGGAQAGHTVVTPAGRRHVFHHFGSGILNPGCTTHLSRFFIVNPLLWKKEYADILSYGGTLDSTTLTVDPRAMLTTPYDMLINQELERARGDKRHGSCGIGINETVRRNLHVHWATHVAKIRNRQHLRNMLKDIRSCYAPDRLYELDVKPSEMAQSVLKSDDVIENFLDVCDLFFNTNALRSTRDVLTTKVVPGPDPYVIFEGAQGLLLDEKHEWFPHVTRSRTGLTNVVTLADEIGVEELEACYVTRAYMTRHGVGPFPSEDPKMSYPDPTNKPNDWQGTLRFGYLEPSRLRETLANDRRVFSDCKITSSLAVTCLDQDDYFWIRLGGGASDVMLHSETIPNFLLDCLGFESGYASYGPTRETVRRVSYKAEGSTRAA